MTLRLNGDSSGFTEIKAANAAGDNSVTLPTSNGGANQLLQNGGTAGELQYTSAGGGLHYDSDGRLLVGRSSAPNNDGALVIQGYAGVTAGEGTIHLLRGNNVTTTTQGLGSIDFGHDQHLGASIDAVSEAAWTEGLSHPTRLTFSTTASGSDAPTARVEIANSGELRLLAGCPGIDFSAAQPAAAAGTMTSETLDSYEQGTWTPSATGGVLANDSWGEYIKIGNRVELFFKVSINSMDNDIGEFKVGGVPFTPKATVSGGGGFTGACMTNRMDYRNAGTAVATYFSNQTGGIVLYSMENNGTWASLRRIDINTSDQVYGTSSFLIA